MSVFRRFLAALADSLEPPTLIARVRFTTNVHGVVLPQIEYYAPFTSKTELVVGATDRPGENAAPGRGAVAPLAPTADGLDLSVTRNNFPDGTNALLFCGLTPVSASIRRWKLTATFTMPTFEEIPPAPGTAYEDPQWAPFVGIRSGANPLDTTDAAPVGATHQTRDGGKIVLGARGGAHIDPKHGDTANQKTYEEVYGATFPAFWLETEIDCTNGNGSARLTTLNNFEMTNTWSHSHFDQPHLPGPPITGVGVGLGMLRGNGQAKVVVREFQVYYWPNPTPFWRRLMRTLR